MGRALYGRYISFWLMLGRYRVIFLRNCYSALTACWAVVCFLERCQHRGRGAFVNLIGCWVSFSGGCWRKKICVAACDPWHRQSLRLVRDNKRSKNSCAVTRVCVELACLDKTEVGFLQEFPLFYLSLYTFSSHISCQHFFVSPTYAETPGLVLHERIEIRTWA